MKNIKLMHKFIICITTFVFIFILSTQSLIFAEEIQVKDQYETQQIVQANDLNNKIITVVSNNIYISKNGIFIKDEKQLISELKKLDFTQINNIVKEEVIENNNYQINEDTIIETIKMGIEEINDDILSGNLKVLEKGTIVDNDDSFYLQGGSTYDQTFWWGKRRYMSTQRANEWCRDLNKLAAVNGGASLLAGAVFGGVGAIPNGLTSMYCWYLASDVAYYNSLSSRGIITDICWWLYYSMRIQ